MKACSWRGSPRKQTEKRGLKLEVDEPLQPANLFYLACIVFFKYLNKLLSHVFGFLAAQNIFSLFDSSTLISFLKIAYSSISDLVL